MSLLSIATVKINGTPVPVLPGTAKLMLGGESREAVVLADDSIEFRVKKSASKLVFEMPVSENTDIDLVNDCWNATVEMIGDDERTHTLQPATRTGDPIELDASDGKATVTIEGKRTR